MLTQKQNSIRTMMGLCLDVYKYNPHHCFKTFTLIVLKHLTSGIGMLLIIPLLQIIGSPLNTTGSNTHISTLFQVFLDYIHISFTLSGVLVSYVVLVSLVALISFAEQKNSGQLQQNYTEHWREKLYRQLLHSKWEFFLKKTSSDLVQSVLNQISILSNSTYQLLNLLNNLFFILVYICLALWLSWIMTLIACLCGLLLLCLLLPLHKKISHAGQAALLNHRKIQQSIWEQLSALKMIKGSCYEHSFVEMTLGQSARLEQHNQNILKITAFTQLFYSCSSCIIFSVLFYCSITLWHYPLETLIILLLVFSRLLPKISAVQQSYQRLLYQLPSLSDLKNLLNECIANKEDIVTDVKKSFVFNNSITLKKVSFAYDTHSPKLILKNLSMEIKKNTITALVGPSGIGKTTLVDLIIGLLEPTSGSIFIDNQILCKTNKCSWRNQIAYVTQNTFLFNETIRFNMQLFGAASEAHIWEALHKASAAQFVANFDKGLDTVVGEKGVRLSLGECQRIALARALLSNPTLLILDETTNSLDRQNISHIQQSLQLLKSSMTILIITHQTQVREIADHFFYLQDIMQNKDAALV